MPNNSQRQARNNTGSCEFCRTRKIRCDGQKPCGKCKFHQKECLYLEVIPKARPTKAVMDALRAENARLLGIIDNLNQHATPETKDTSILRDARDEESDSSAANAAPGSASACEKKVNAGEFVEIVPNRPPLDTSPYLCVDELGNCNSFGPSSAWQTGDMASPVVTTPRGNMQNTLVANAALARQLEHRLTQFRDLDGTPIDLAMHLLDLHWNRQHHTFLLTYRPVIIRDLLQGGEFGSRFLLNSIFASVAKFSTRPETREFSETLQCDTSPFLRRCDELISTEHILLNPSIPAVVGLLLLGSTYVARGATTKGWLLTGSALRMVYDLGLHIDRKDTEDEVKAEIRKRVFWGAFICDKLQSLYLGRPFAIKLRDAHVSLELNDILEENEIWTPYLDPACPQPSQQAAPKIQIPVYSVSCFQRLCLLAKIMARIIDDFYVVGATPASAQCSLREIDHLLREWEENLPEQLRIRVLEQGALATVHSPNVLCLHVIYNAMVILLHRPLVADGHLRSASPPATSWKRCSETAKQITHLVGSYYQLYGLRGAPYLISYGLYVACTIHVRNVSMNPNDGTCRHRCLLEHSLHWLEELAVPNPAVERSVAIIRKLMSDRGVSVSIPSVGPTNPMQAHPNNMMAQTAVQNVVPFTEFTMNMDGGPGGSGSAWNESFSDDVLYGILDRQAPVDVVPA